MPPKFYAVRRGRTVGVFHSWDECAAATQGYSGAVYKSFSSAAAATAFVGGGSAVAPAARGSVRTRATATAGGGSDEADAPAEAEAVAPSDDDDDAPLDATTTTPRADPTALYRLHFDGACRGNHIVGGADAAVGAVITHADTGAELGRVSARLDAPATNNAAEWAALEAGLTAALQAGATRLEAVGDSSLVINQVTGEWAARHPAMAAARDRATALTAQFEMFTARHVRREHNALADALANAALDGGGWRGLRGGGGEDDPDTPPPPAPSSFPPPPLNGELPKRRPGSAFDSKRRPGSNTFDWSGTRRSLGGVSGGSVTSVSAVVATRRPLWRPRVTVAARRVLRVAARFV